MPASQVQIRLSSTETSGGNKLWQSFEQTRAPVEVRDNVLRVGDKHVPNIWLRDNCQCSTCFHPETNQRLIDTFKIPSDLEIKTSSSDGTYTSVEWSDGHKSKYSNSLLRHAAGSFEERAKIRQGIVEPTLWGAEISESQPKVPHDSPHAIKDTLRKIRQYGFCMVTGLDASSTQATQDFLEKISFIRPTHYGGFYDFTADLASKDTAYTNIALEAHTDNTYFSDPAGLQAFHVISHTEGEGGASLLVDGFKVAHELKTQDPAAYKTLSSVNVHAHASGNAGISIQPYRGFPVLQHDPATGSLLQVRWNTSDRAGIELPISETGRWYDAARKFDALLKKKENEYWEQLQPGTLLIFDNWRVLHGRSAFTGKRRICGAYIARDDWVSRFKMLEDEEGVLGRLAAS